MKKINRFDGYDEKSFIFHKNRNSGILIVLQDYINKFYLCLLKIENDYLNSSSKNIKNLDELKSLYNLAQTFYNNFFKYCETNNINNYKDVLPEYFLEKDKKLVEESKIYSYDSKIKKISDIRDKFFHEYQEFLIKPNKDK